MILQPSEMNFSNKNFSMIISGSPGTGKTTLALSAPGPILIDFDKGISRVKAQHRSATIVSNTYEEVLQDIQSDEVKEAQTIIIDTGGSFVTLLQDWAMRSNPAANKQKNGAISLKGFGAVKNEFVRFTNTLQYTMNKNIIYIFHTVEERDGDNVRQRLLCEGAARNLVWQPCDLGCYMFMVGQERVLGFTPTEEYFAKGSYGINGIIKVPKLDDDKPNNLLTQLFEKARQEIAEESKIYEADKKAYQAVMKKGKKIIEGIEDAEGAEKAVSEIKKLDHILTSKRELNAVFQQQIRQIGVTFDKESGKYVAV